MEIYKFDIFDKRIALNVNSNTCEFIDDTDDYVIDFITKNTSDLDKIIHLSDRRCDKAIRSSWKKLNDSGILSDLISDRVDERLGKSDSYTLTLNVTQSCNLRCKYCYLDHSFFSKNRNNMNIDTSKRAIDFMFENFPSMKNFGISYYGGEPLINFPAIKASVLRSKYLCEMHNVNFSGIHVSTNGTLLNDEYASFLNENKANILISLDGDESTHDTLRRDAGDNGTHLRVLNAIELIKKKYPYIKIGASAVITNERRLIDAYRYLSSFNFDDIKASYVRYRGKDFFTLDNNSKFNYIEDLSSIAKDCLDKIINNKRPAFYEFTCKILHFWTKLRRSEFCPAGRNRFGVDSNGIVYACGPAISMQDDIFGDIKTGLNKKTLNFFLDRNNIEKKNVCRSCWARYTCGGGCPLPLVKDSEENCELTLTTTRLAAWIYLSIKEKNEYKLSVLIDDHLPDYINTIVDSAAR